MYSCTLYTVQKRNHRHKLTLERTEENPHSQKPAGFGFSRPCQSLFETDGYISTNTHLAGRMAAKDRERTRSLQSRHRSPSARSHPPRSGRLTCSSRRTEMQGWISRLMRGHHCTASIFTTCTLVVTTYRIFSIRCSSYLLMSVAE